MKNLSLWLKIVLPGVLFIALIGIYVGFYGSPKRAPSALPPSDPSLTAVPPTKPDPIKKPGHLSFNPTGAMVSVDLGATGEARSSITVRNDGQVPVQIQSVLIDGDGALFGRESSCTVLEEKGECTITLIVKPERPGAFNGRLVVVNDGSERFATVPLAAVAIEAPKKTPEAPEQTYDLAELLRTERATGARPDEVGGPAPAQRKPVVLSNEIRVRPTDREAGSAVSREGAFDDTRGGPGRVGKRQRVARDEESEDYGDYPATVSSQPVDRTLIITNDRFIPCVLNSSVNSQFSGRVTAHVERDVYGADGAVILIPAGSSVVGAYMGGLDQGQSRIAIVWQRILLPNGAHILIEEPGADVMGRAGIPGVVDRRFFSSFGNGILVSLFGAGVSAGAAAAQTGIQISPLSAMGAVSVTSGSPAAMAASQAAQSIAQQTQGLTQQILSKPLAPVITLAQGQRFLITPTTDIVIALPRHGRGDWMARAVADRRDAGGDGPLRARRRPLVAGDVTGTDQDPLPQNEPGARHSALRSPRQAGVVRPGITVPGGIPVAQSAAANGKPVPPPLVKPLVPEAVPDAQLPANPLGE